MNHVFLSHSSKDHEKTQTLYDELLKLGFRVWLDEVAMEPGDSLIEKIGSAIRSSMNLAVLLSENSVNSEWVKKEVSVAMTGQLAGAKIKVVPIRLDDAELPPFLTDIRYVDYRKETNEKLEFARLVKMLLATSLEGTLLRLVSLNAEVTATEHFNHRFGPANVLSPSSESDRDGPRTYWLTPDDTPATITLKLSRAYPIRLLRILNTQNQHVHDRATTRVSIKFTVTKGPESTVWEGAVPPYDTWLNLWFDSTYADTLHVKVEDWNGRGGGLNCIEIYSDD